MSISSDQIKINELLTRGVENIYPKPEFLKERLESGDKLKIYLGIDPTGPTLHLGHVSSMIKLRQFQNLGHQVILLIGSFTAMIGDPTDKMAVRKQLTREQVLQNCKNYLDQASVILNFEGANPAQVKYNDEWLGKLSFHEVIELASHFTVQQMLERDMFEKRINEGKPVHLHEFLYPLMQGYDTVAMDVDGEVGGNDQTFNMLAGRTLLKQMKNKEKFVITTRLLVDSQGSKMGKTTGNMIALADSPEEKFGKTMAMVDELIVPTYELCTFEPQRKVEDIKKALNDGENPRDHKLDLAETIVAMYHGKDEAKKQRENFLQKFQKKETPDEMEEMSLAGKNVVDALVEAKMVKSKSEAKRNLQQNGVKINGKVIDETATVKKGDVLQKGKRFFVKIK